MYDQPAKHNDLAIALKVVTLLSCIPTTAGLAYLTVSDSPVDPLVLLAGGSGILTSGCGALALFVGGWRPGDLRTNLASPRRWRVDLRIAGPGLLEIVLGVSLLAIAVKEVQEQAARLH